MFGRDTNWRQGSVLNPESTKSLNLIEENCSNRIAIVITHDCDLASELEEFIDVIVGVHTKELDPMLVAGRNPRRLHLELYSVPDSRVPIELCHTNRHTIYKKHRRLLQQTEDFSLSDNEKRTLKQWLAARYGRPAFPNSFETRLRTKKGKRTVEQQIAKIVKPYSNHLVGLFLDLGENRTIELPDGTPYYISISIVYDAVEGGTKARLDAEKASQEISALFTEVYGPVETTTDVGLENCEAVADTFMTLSDIRRIDQWRLEYLSLGDIAGEYLPVGEIP